MKKYIDRVLKEVEKPARYIGNEYNSVHKDPDNVKVRVALAFPDVYEIGMSHLGIKILYHLLNRREDVYCERVFCPWVDMEEKMKQEHIPLFSLETKSPIVDFDVFGFTLQYELSFTNVLNMIDIAGIPLLSRDRTKEHPFVIAGGPCAYNVEPMAQFFDFVVMGEGEEIIEELIDLIIEWKKSKKDRDVFLKTVSRIPGVYVPDFYKITYNDDGTVKAIEKKVMDAPNRIIKRIIKDLDGVFCPTDLIVPYMDVVHDRAVLEIFRGCIRGCRFCQAGMIYRPVRERSVDNLVKQAEKMMEATGYEEIGLASLSASDYTGLEELTRKLLDRFSRQGVGISLPSLRVDSFSLKLAEKAQQVRKSGLTFAPEAGTQRLRDVINKNITDEDLFESVEAAFKMGWNRIKLYFMIGLPTETYEDLQGIVELVEQVVRIYEAARNSRKGLGVTVSTSSFVPKAFTPFQWVPQVEMGELEKRQKYLKQRLKGRSIVYNWHDIRTSFLEAVFARGDRRLGEVLVKAWEKGCKFDGWSEQFRFDVWIKAFEECNIDPSFYANRERNFDETLPWDHIDVGIDKKFLIREYRKALKGEITKNCRQECNICGIQNMGVGCCYVNKG